MWAMLLLAVACLLGAYSLMGRITGVYRLPGLDDIGQGRGYLVLHGDRWFGVLIWDGGEQISGREFRPEQMVVVSGIWIADLHMIKDPPLERVRAHAPTNLFDVYALRFGRFREEIIKLGPDWVDPAPASVPPP